MYSVLFYLLILAVFSFIIFRGSSYYLIRKLMKDKSKVYIDVKLNIKKDIKNTNGYKLKFVSEDQKSYVFSDNISLFNFGYYYLVELNENFDSKIFIRPRIFYDFIKFRKLNRLERFKNELL